MQLGHLIIIYSFNKKKYNKVDLLFFLVKMNDSLFGFTLEEVNSDPERLKKVLVNYSSNVKSYAKWFEINEIDKNEDKFTSYRVVCRVNF